MRIGAEIVELEMRCCVLCAHKMRNANDKLKRITPERYGAGNRRCNLLDPNRYYILCAIH